METFTVNYWAVLVAGIAYNILGALWYSPALFGNTWMSGIGKTKEQLEKDFTPLNYLWAFIASILVAYGMARIMLWSGADSIADGIKVALVVGVCFLLATTGINDIFEKRPCKLTIINISYHFVGVFIAAIIIGVWR